MKDLAEDGRRSYQYSNLAPPGRKFNTLPPGPTFQVSRFRTNVFRGPIFSKHFTTRKYIYI
jgi:hypothetical protein